MTEYCCVRDAGFKKLEDLYELETVFALSGNVIVVLADPTYNTRSVRGQVSFAHDVITKIDVEDAATLICSVVAFGAHVHTFCSNLMLLH